MGLASGSKGAGHADNDDLLVCPLLAGIVLLRTAADGGVRFGDGGPSSEENV